MSSKRITLVLGILLVGIVGYIGYRDAVSTWQYLQEQENKIEQLNQTFEELSRELDETKETKDASQEEVKKLEKEKAELEEQRQELERQLQAKRDAERRLAQASSRVIDTATNTAVINASGLMTNCGDNQYAAFIYGMESGGRVVGNCDPSARNASGCLGIGQACPGSKLLNVCSDLSYECQNEFFTNYAISRYGSWQNAYNFWVANSWW